MAINSNDLRGVSGAQTFLLPQVEAYHAPVQQPFNDGIQALDGIQQVNGQTNDYYQKVANLKSFMQDVNKNYGIDVRVPDSAKPESIKLNEVYRTLLADIMAQGNLLQNSQKEHMVHLQRGDRYVADPTQQAVTQMRPNADYFTTQLEPVVSETNNLTQQPSYDDKDYEQKKAVYDEKIAQYQQQMKEHPEQAERIKYQMNALTPPARAIKQFAPARESSYDRATGRKIRAAGNFVTDVSHIQEGLSDSYKLDPNYLSPTTKNPLQVSNTYEGSKYGTDAEGKPRTIKAWGHDPKTNETFVFFQGGGVKNVTEEGTLGIVRTLLGSNSDRYGIDAEYVDQWAEEKGYYTNTGEFDRSKVRRKDAAQIMGQRLAEQDASTSKAKQAALKAKLTDLKSKKSYWLTPNASMELTTPDNKSIVVKKKSTNGNLYIANSAELLAPTGDKRTDNKLKKLVKELGENSAGVSPERMFEILANMNVHETLEPTGTTEPLVDQQPQAPAQPQQGQLTPAQILEDYRKRNQK